ncbi:MAG TPA: glutathione S-transferase family protein [Burkholderiales bacterium]|jgi:glutathione S-transferase|nr:glutathione S-transferase family protein [Burkholderiales bacterium]HSA70040.1 glutathione S-transferase family protein [Burkholderiales bacterium]
MLRLCGFHVSNYHNKVRIALLEKDVPFEEDPTCTPSQKDGFVARSPMGKVPFLELDGGRRLAESEVILEYLEDAYPQKPLLPKDPFERAKVRELVTVTELHLELPTRRLYGHVFFKKPASEEVIRAVEKDLAKGVRALRTLVKFDPYIAGGEVTIADCAAFVHLPLVSLTTKLAYGRDILEDLAPLKPYLKMLGERPAFRRVNEDRKTAQAALAKK